MCTGVKMTTRDIRFDTFSPSKMAEMEQAYPSEGKGKLAYTPVQRAQIAMMRKQRKRQAEQALERNKKEDAEKRLLLQQIQ